MARRSQCSSAGDNPLDPNYLPPHYREEYRIAIDALVEEDLEGYYKFIQNADVVDFLSTTEIEFIQSSVQAPQQSHHPEQHFVETGGDGSSDTYWPIHSDLEVPGLDLGWPQLHPFIEPTEVTTLVNPPEPDMPSIKEQARRLIKNAQQVIAVVMDMFTDVDMFADILNAAMRNVAVYILLDEQNAHHFVNMVSNCRVNLQSIQFLRVRTVSGITYHCRSGKSFKGQMMDRFLLTDCRAVLSGNYSFMWSFEKLHRCMAHLFLGQLVATFDEEFRILFAQSQPLVIENVTTQIADLSLLQKRQYPSERTSLYRDTRKFLSLDTVHPEDRVKHSYDERMDPDWRMVALKKQASLHGPSDMYSRFPPRLDPPFDQGPSRTPKMENAFKRHSYAEGVHGKFSYPFLQQQGTPEPENQGRQFHRGHQPYPGPGPEADYSGYDKFWGQDCHSADQYSEPGLPQEMQPPDNFDPVLNYLSSTRNVDFDQGPDKLDLPFGSSHPRRLSLGQPYACQTSPTTSNPPDQKQFVQEPNTDRKDPTVKRGLRNWRISSYLSAYDNPEDLPLGPVQASDPFEETSNPIQQTAPAIDVSFPKIPNVREFKVPAIPRASQMPNYIKNIREKPKKSPDEPPAVATETKITPTPSDSSSTTEGEKTEEVEQKEPKTIGLRREESFRRKYNAAVPRSSRLRSSLIFSSLEQQHSSQDEGSEANEAEQTKLPFVSQVLGQRRSATREPIEWSRFIKSATDASKQDDGTGKADDKDTSKEENEQESVKSPDTEQTDPSPSTPRSKASKAQQPKTDQPAKSLLTAPVTVDMSDPDNRLMFFKELAAKRKAAKAAEAEKCKDKALVKPPTDLKTTTVKREKPEPQEDSEKMATTPPSAGLSPKNVPADEANKAVPTETEACESDASDKTNKYDSHVKNDSGMSQSYKEEETTIPTDSKKTELKKQPATSQSVSAETGSPPSKQDHKTVAKESSPLHRPTPANVPSLTGGTDEGGSSNLCSTSKGTISLSPTSVEVPSSASAALNSNIESAQLETSITSSALQPEQPTGSEFSSSDPSALLSTPKDTSSSNATPKDSSSPTSSSILSPNSAKIGAQESAYESTQAHPALVSPLMPPEAPSAVVSALKTSDISPATYAASEEENTCSSQFTTESNSEESCAPTPSEKHLADSENNSAVEALAPSSHKSGLTTVSDPESSTPRPSETCPAVNVSPKASQPTTSASHQDARMQVTPPSELNLTRSVIPAPVETVCSSPLTDSDGSVMLPKAEKTDTNMSTSCPSDTPSVPKQIRTDSNKPSVFPSTKTEPNSEIPREPEPTPGSVASQSQPSEPPVPAENSKEDHQSEVSKEPELTNSGEKRPEDREATNKVDKSTTYESVKSEKTNDQVRQNNCLEPAEITSEEVPLSPQSKQTKPTHSRYHSSTANVLSSSNLRDDTKLLLEQISANSQCRNEATKESPVTDDEKEDEADKNAKREKERGIRTPSKGEPKSSQEKDKLLEKFQSMRKERKVYSRFEV